MGRGGTALLQLPACHHPPHAPPSPEFVVQRVEELALHRVERLFQVFELLGGVLREASGGVRVCGDRQVPPPGSTCAEAAHGTPPRSSWGGHLVVHEQAIVEVERVVGSVVNQRQQGLKAAGVDGRGVELRGAGGVACNGGWVQGWERS